MLNVTVNREDGIVTLEPDGVLTQKDFESAATVIDPYIEMAGTLNGVIIHTKVFPGWDSFAAMLTHLKFVQDHHKRVSHVAFVTDSKAEVKHFRFGELQQARLWVLGLG